MNHVHKENIIVAFFDAGKPKGRRGRSKPVERARVAHHEAAHAIIAFALGLHIEEVSIRPGEDYLGRCTGPNAIYGYEGATSRQEQSKLAKDHAIVLYAGLAAESLFFGIPFAFDDTAKHGAWDDDKQARALMARHYNRWNPNTMRNVQQTARRLVRKHRTAISRMSKILLIRETLRGEELQQVLAELVGD